MSRENYALGLEIVTPKGREDLNTAELVRRMYNLAEKNIKKLSIPGMTPQEFRKKFCDLKDRFVTQIEVRNKVAHGFPWDICFCGATFCFVSDFELLNGLRALAISSQRPHRTMWRNLCKVRASNSL